MLMLMYYLNFCGYFLSFCQYIFGKKTVKRQKVPFVIIMGKTTKHNRKTERGIIRTGLRIGINLPPKIGRQLTNACRVRFETKVFSSSCGLWSLPADFLLRQVCHNQLYISGSEK